MSDIAMIRAAAGRIKDNARLTPLLSSPFLDEIAGRHIWVKAECLQHTGSFKFRGAWSAISALPDSGRKRGVIAFSSGNHAQGVALAAARHGVASTIIMPGDAPAIKIANTRALGAEVVLFDRTSEDRDEVATKYNKERNLTLIKPYDNPYVLAGQGTTGLEIAAQAAKEGITDADVLVPCGGGGLTSGIALALEADAPAMRVHPCEPENFDDVARSLKSGKIEVNPAKNGSVCDAIITPSPGELTFPLMQRLCAPAVVVSDDECLQAMALAFDRLRIVIEPGGAAALAGALFHSDELQGEHVIVVASGGNVDRQMFEIALETA
jgi:threonine dehydratase